MHLKTIHSAVTPMSSTGFWPAYNLFRCKRSLDLFCAVPEDYPVPAFVDGYGWEFAGKVGEHSSRVSGFDRKAARAVVPLTGFYLITAFQARRESMDAQPMRWAA